MPSILSDSDKEIVKRMIPKASNKIQAVAVAKLYIAYPNRARWQYTGLQGAIVLANDLVGNTYWLKLVDISVGNGRNMCSYTITYTGIGCWQRGDMGPGNIRSMELQSGSNVLSHFRDRGLSGWTILRR